ncbi:MAG: hypothetical protein H6712_23110 [Myxococcales bacterium]|nr:hypothetical protein [Myxococcales bacterium]MCB9716766.1 hypothetical protein [Myxococcales bacterium]
MARPGRLAAVLAHPRLPWLAALLGVLLASPALAQGLQLDDLLHRAWVELALQGEAPGPWWDFYAVARDPESNRMAMEVGASPWWALPELRIRFWRPLSAATHVVDYGLWPDAAWLMHAESLAWYGGLVLAVGALLRRLLGPTWVAGLGTVLYAIDDAHAVPASWIAQRNALIVAVLVVTMLWAHDRARRDGWRPGRWLGPLLLGAALLAGESAVAGLGYLVAHALLLEPHEQGATRGARLLRAARGLVPYGVVLVGWRLLYTGLGYGAHGSGVYLDPAREPGAYVAVLPDRIAALALGELAWPTPESWAADPMPWTLVRWGAVAAVGLLGLGLAPRLGRERGLAVLVVGAGLALLPAATAVPSARLLLLVGVGASAAVASVIAVALGEGGVARWRWPAVVLAIPLLLIHGALAPVMLVHRIVERGRSLERASATTVEGFPADEALAQQTLVIVNAPPTFIAATLWLTPGREAALPRSLRLLGSTFAPVVVQRPDPRSLVLQPVGGYLGDPFTTLLRGPAHPFAAGDTVALAGWSVRVLGVAHGRPSSVRFDFDEPLDDPSLRWIVWRDGRFVPFEPPAPGRAAAIPGVVP